MNAIQLLVMLTAAVSIAAPVEDPRGFRFEVPAGFEAQPDLATGIRTWQRANQDSPSFAALTLTGLGGTIAQVPTNHAIVESSAREAAAPAGITMESFTYRTLVWKDLELEVLESRANANGTELFQLTVQLPFEREAMQVGLLGLASSDALLRHDFDTFIRSFDGLEDRCPAPRPSARAAPRFGLRAAPGARVSARRVAPASQTHALINARPTAG